MAEAIEKSAKAVLIEVPYSVDHVSSSCEWQSGASANFVQQDRKVHVPRNAAFSHPVIPAAELPVKGKHILRNQCSLNIKHMACLYFIHVRVLP